MKNIAKIFTVLLLAAGMVACESMKLGDAGLSKAPESSGATLDTLFATITDADKVLTQAYYYLPYALISDFDSKMGKDIVESITDHFISNKHTEGDGPNDLYYTGALDPSISGDAAGGETYRFGSEKDYTAIRYALIFLENADKIPNADASLLARRKGEAKMILAISYANMIRYVGGVPIMDHSVELGEDMHYPRNTFKEVIEYIVQMCDEAASVLPWSVSEPEAGRLTAAAALGLKLRMLCFAASPTFNSNTPWHPDAADWENMGKYVRYGQTYDKGLWDRAKATAEEFVNKNIGNDYQLEQAQTPTSRGRREAYRKAYFERSSRECIISIRKSNSTSYHDTHIDLQDDFGCGGSLNWVNKFPFADGTSFPEDWDWEDPSSWPEQPFFKPDATGMLIVDGQHFIETRDPRLYENLCVPGDLWKNGVVGATYWNAKSPNYQDGCTGFLMMKYVLQQDQDRKKYPHWCMMRLAEVYLNAAEALNESEGGPSEKAYTFVNEVRARVGLPELTPGLNREQFRKALILERELEFGFEEVRWFDMVRWGLTEAFTTKLQKLYVTGVGKIKNATQFTYKVMDAFPSRKWYNDWDTKWYLAPIPNAEINKNYGMTQNPGW